MKPIKVYILENETPIQQSLKESLESLGYHVCGMQTNAELALQEIRTLQPSIVFLDAKATSSKTGVWLGNQLNIPMIYLVSVLDDIKTLTKTIVTNPASYLVKPFGVKQLLVSLQFATSTLEEKKEITFKEGNTTVTILIKDIKFVKKEKNHLKLYLKDAEKTMHTTIDFFLKKVNSSSFLKVHDFYVVNKNHITTFNTKEIKMDENTIPIAPSYLNDVLQYLT